MKAKIFIAINPEGLQGLAGSGDGPNVMTAFLEELDGIEVEWAMLEEGKELIELVEDVDIIIPGVSDITAEVMDAAKRLKGIIQAGVGLDTVDIDAARDRNIPVANEPEGSAVAMGEYAFLLMMCASRRILEARELMKQGIFLLPTTTEMNGKTLGLIGLGRSARELAKRAKAFDMKIIGIDKYADQIDMKELDFKGVVDDLDYILETSDFVSIHCPANDETRGMLNYDTICKMKPTAFLINLARAGIVDREGFIRAVKEKRIKGAGIDVFWDEPMEPDDEILNLPPSVFSTPHIATSTVESRERIFRATAGNIRKVLHGEKPTNCAW